MAQRKEGRPGEARAASRRSVRENGCVSDVLALYGIIAFALFCCLKSLVSIH